MSLYDIGAGAGLPSPQNIDVKITGYNLVGGVLHPSASFIVLYPKMKKLSSIFALIGISLIIASCQAAATPQARPTRLPTGTPAEIRNRPVPTITAVTATATSAAITPTTQPTLTETTTPTSTPQAVGPDHFPAGINPLSGLPVSHPENLSLPPALVSITNFPITSRPQAGLSFSPFVFEMYIGEGASRFLAVFYGDYPTDPAGNNDVEVGPIRSGRRPYESLRELFRGFLVFASASRRVYPYLSEFNVVYGNDTDVNHALMKSSQVQQIATASQSKLGKPALSGLKFDSQPPAGGKTGKMIWVPYNKLDQVIWHYDTASGSYVRFEDNADGKTFTQMTDRLNGKPLTYQNVVIQFVKDHRYDETLFDFDLLYITKMPALLFRDGQVYPIFWTTGSSTYERTTGLMRPIRFMDAQGNAFPLKPGQTWVEMVPQFTPTYETVDSQVYDDLIKIHLPGSGNWAIRFYVPALEK
ncbi:MAG: DUF3048 C-terminal domain-containing protein [Anaerolineaceae bacterium]|nr:DUF3048 C-terminal domain-containing protein [Anaerolineaceae bacterium]